jgi:hypothetical protein
MVWFNQFLGDEIKPTCPPLSVKIAWIHSFSSITEKGAYAKGVSVSSLLWIRRSGV